MGKIVGMPGMGILEESQVRQTSDLQRVIQALTLLLPVQTNIDSSANLGQFVQASGAVTITLPPPIPAAAGYAIGVQSLGTGPCTILTLSGLIVGAGFSGTSMQLPLVGQFTILLCDGTNWNSIAGLNSLVSGPICGVAQYNTRSLTFESPFTDWVPNPTDLYAGPDSIGLTLDSTRVEIPVGWFWDASVVFTIQLADDAPTGESLAWWVGASGGTDGGGVTNLLRHDAISGYNGDVITVAGNIFGAASSPSSVPPNYLSFGDFNTLLSTPFYPTGFAFAMRGLYSFPCEFLYTID